MRIVGFYFTGTGNTQDAARAAGNRLSAAGNTVTLRNIEDSDPRSFDPDSADLFILFFPVYSWDVPPVVRSFIRALPRSAGKRAAGDKTNRRKALRGAVLAVDGGGGLSAANIAGKLLRRRGIDVFLAARASYTENWTMFSNPPEPQESNTINGAGRRMAEDFAERIIEERGGWIEDHRTAGAILGVVGFLFRAAGRRFLSQAFAADSDCTGCGLCVRTCPAHAIRMSGKEPKRPVWRLSCQSCNRCINICPERAINTSVRRLIILLIGTIGIYAALIPPAVRLARSLISGADWIIVLVLILAGNLIGLIVLPPLMELLGRIPGCSRFLEKSINKGYRRYVMEGFKPGEGHSHRE
jgi:ferredoxin